MTGAVETTSDASLDSSLPAGAVSLESILCTEELQRRPWRPAQYEKENRALVKLVSALADSPSTVLQTLEPNDGPGATFTFSIPLDMARVPETAHIMRTV